MPSCPSSQPRPGASIAARMRLPDRPPFALRARVLSPLDDGGILDLHDGLLEVDERGRVAAVRDMSNNADSTDLDGLGGLEPIDIRPFILLPGMVDLHAHLPQLPN